MEAPVSTPLEQLLEGLDAGHYDADSISMILRKTVVATIDTLDEIIGSGGTSGRAAVRLSELLLQLEDQPPLASSALEASHAPK